MFNLDPGKLLVIAVVAIILLGPDRLPQVARQVGAAWRSFNEFRHRMESEVRSTMPDLPPASEIARLARSPSALLNHLSNMSENGTDEPGAEGTDGAEHAAAEHGGTEAVSSNGAGVPASDNGAAPAAAAAGETAAPLAPQPRPQSPAPWSPPAPVAPLPETAVPVDPSLN